MFKVMSILMKVVMWRDKRTKCRAQGHSMFLTLNTVKISKLLLSIFEISFEMVKTDLIPSNPEPCFSWWYCYTYRSLAERLSSQLV